MTNEQHHELSCRFRFGHSVRGTSLVAEGENFVIKRGVRRGPAGSVQLPSDP
jgi:hypothetical protein